ncbi:MAG TPA: cytochrome P450 [Rhizobiaceae bacterium]|nr:cytochrome P450 [Rhizobiaceae bacterium]
MAETAYSDVRKTPRAPGFDSTLAFLSEGYDFVSRRCRRLGSDVFTTRIMLRKVVCVRGAAAAEMFYGHGHFTRKGAMPQTVLRLLQDKGSVQLLDGRRHRHRKAMFLAMLLPPAELERMRTLFRREWLLALEAWEHRGDIVLFDAVNLILTRAACAWVGIPPGERNPDTLWPELSAMIENAGSFGPGNWRALFLRRRTERFIRSLVERVQRGEMEIPEGTPLRVVCEHKEEGNIPIDPDSATVEIINLIRPIVAIGRFVMFAAMALHTHPEWQERFRRGEDETIEPFCEEVRRLYPFFPIIGGRAIHDFEWHGHAFRKNDWVLLDLHGTNHDPRRFPDPDSFEPGRPIGWQAQGFDFIPQGGGEAAITHRCPGEAMTVEVMKEAVRLLTRAMSYRVPSQDLEIDLSRMPARPASGFVISDIQAIGPEGPATPR